MVACGDVPTLQVPEDPTDALGTVALHFSVDSSTFYAFEPEKTFRFEPYGVCDVYGSSAFPPGCDIAKLGDGVCHAECNTRACSNDNRDCSAPDVVMSLGGDDDADGSVATPVRTLARALDLACSGFVSCLNVVVQPGSYPCANVVASTVRKNVTISASNPSLPPLFQCDDPSYVALHEQLRAVLLGVLLLLLLLTVLRACHRSLLSGGQTTALEFATSYATLSGIEVATSIGATLLGSVTLEDVTLTAQGSLRVHDSYATLTRVTTSGAAVTLTHDASRTAT